MRLLSVLVSALVLFAAFVVLWPAFARQGRPPDSIVGALVEDPVLRRAWSPNGRPATYLNWKESQPAAPPGRRVRRVEVAVMAWNKPRAQLPTHVAGRAWVEGRHASGSSTRHWAVIAEVEVPSAQRRLTVGIPPLGQVDVALDPLPERARPSRVVDLPGRDLSLADESRGAWRAARTATGWRFTGDPALSVLVVGEVEPGVHRLVQRVGGTWTEMQLYIVPRRDGAPVSVRFPKEFASDLVTMRVFARDGREIRPRRVDRSPLGRAAYVPVPRERIGGVELARRRVRWRRIL